MKKEVMKIVNDGNGRIRLNNISSLHRWTDSYGMPVDRLEICFDNINHVNFGGSVEIISRDYEGIIAECEKATVAFLNDVAERLTKDLKCGYNSNLRKVIE